MTTLRLLALLLVLAAPGRAQVIISEFLASNSNSIGDEDGEHEDWIEIHNPTGSAVSLLGWYLTDDANQPRKWACQDGRSTPARIFWSSHRTKNRKPASGNLHTNFKLETSPDYLALTHDIAGGGVEVVTEFNPYPQQATDLSYGLASTTLTTPLVGAAAPVKAHIPASGALGDNVARRSANEPFDDAGWLSGTTGVGFGDQFQRRRAGESQAAARIRTPAPGLSATPPARRIPARTAARHGWRAIRTPLARRRRAPGLMQFVAAENDQVATPGHTDFDQTQCTVTFWMRSAASAARATRRRCCGIAGQAPA